MERRVLVAGVGNVFLGDDGFGVEVVRALGAHPVPAGVDVVDVGVRGVHLAYQLLDGYRTLVLVDAVSRGEPPGTLQLIEVFEAGSGPVEPSAVPALDGHRMGPDAVLALLATLSAGTGGTPPDRVLVVGCEPGSTAEGMGLSAPVGAAVGEAVRMVLRVLDEETRTTAGTGSAAEAAGDSRSGTSGKAEASSC
ncbi:hydrogenase maturation protease [Streptomyces clavuligerus]|uniref:Putative NiFe-hydrogenase-specific protease n=1 Tax=Streptomyces clavuligerus TaxID=1901 RepID=B5H086_STRCL|nr:hydrogenase maturation protease [Streptomyces clavuligerus]ANW22106.1 protease [Streptomyces clavuligerus]AXU16745.1 hydrogenase maturation protease [Streptomyces clavuligerus]EDY51982.1 hydrogenase-specific C-terminal protease [Streptomyces clavuligerus]EFG05415.1 Putative NiFe-hydrogenase-specific protease [Streptomyces clavuligerus]MBY6306202.1 hydrogenase maturation protease [Streptomyces clavuligerus]